VKVRDVKEFIQATALFSGVLSLYTLPIIAVLSPAEREVITAIQSTTPIREAVFHLPEPKPVEVIADVVEENINPDASEAEPEINNLSAQPAESELDPEPTPVVAEAMPEPAEPRRRRRGRYRNCKDNDGISANGSGYNVSRAVVDDYAHITRYRRLGHVSWHESDTGERDGFRLRRINCDLRQAGIRNGDVVTSVNGRTVRTIPQGIALWLKVRRKNQVVLEILRRGNPITITYELT